MAPALIVETQDEATASPRSDANATSGEDLTRTDFADKAEVQSALDADPSDPHGVDLDLDGTASEAQFIIPVDISDSPDDEGAGRRDTPTAAAPSPLVVRTVHCEDFTFQEAGRWSDHLRSHPRQPVQSGPLPGRRRVLIPAVAQS